ncbi:MAG: NADP-dependent oxidoreductase, partial [Terriglobus roseus]|nr:NADP-dependent oxidoreductase [Terriglobus roseus]
MKTAAFRMATTSSSSALPTTMRALLHNQTTQSLTLATSHPTPTPDLAAREHLLRVSATALTRGELLWPRPADAGPYSPGVEMAGEVVEPVPAGSAFPAGTRVYMRTTFPRCGSARDYAVGREAELARRPRNVSAEEAAATAVGALTAWQGLFVHGGVHAVFDDGGKKANAGRRVLVNGAAGAVGMWAVQLARAAGCEVVGTASGAAKKAAVRAAGAVEVVDYRETSIRAWAEADEADRKVDLVFDTVGGASLDDAWWAVKPAGGLVLSIVPAADMVWRWVLDRPAGVSERVSGKFFIMDSNGEHLGRVTELIEQNLARPTVDSVFALEEFEKAFERVDSGKTTGKVVLKVAGTGA